MTKLFVLYRVYRLWRRTPHLRLGQLIVNSTDTDRSDTLRWIFYASDAALLMEIQAFTDRYQ